MGYTEKQHNTTTEKGTYDEQAHHQRSLKKGIDCLYIARETVGHNKYLYPTGIEWTSTTDPRPLPTEVSINSDNSLGTSKPTPSWTTASRARFSPIRATLLYPPNHPRTQYRWKPLLLPPGTEERMLLRHAKKSKVRGSLFLSVCACPSPQ